MSSKKLDNPVYYALTETHQHLAISYGGIKFYQPQYCPFGGFINISNTENGIEKYARLINNFYVVGDKPNYKNKGACKYHLKNELVCGQMILDKPYPIEISEKIIELCTTTHKGDLYNLVNLVQPGYFKNKTSEMGNYYGIYKDAQLVAVTGERMKMKKYTEVSAVVTHSQHVKNGYAKQLVYFTCNKIFEEGKIPYLHVADTNMIAIKLYEKLGFEIRRKISFWNFATFKN